MRFKRKNKHSLKVGDYVVASKRNDGLANEQWEIGYISSMENGRIYLSLDPSGQTLCPVAFKRAKKISLSRAHWLLSNATTIHKASAISSLSLWNILFASDDELSLWGEVLRTYINKGKI